LAGYIYNNALSLSLARFPKFGWTFSLPSTSFGGAATFVRLRALVLFYRRFYSKTDYFSDIFLFLLRNIRQMSFVKASFVQVPFCQMPLCPLVQGCQIFLRTTYQNGWQRVDQMSLWKNRSKCSPNQFLSKLIHTL
jgi:hypothetical protein